MEDSHFKFWAATVPKNGTHTPKHSSNEILHLTSVALGNTVSNGRTTLMVECDGTKGVLCTLVPNKIENAQLELLLEQKAVLSVKGPNALHLCGYKQPVQSFDGMTDLDEIMTPIDISAPRDDSSEEAVPEAKPVAVEEDEEEESPPAKVALEAPVSIDCTVTEEKAKAPTKKEKKANKKKRKLSEVVTEPEAKEAEAPQKKKKKKKKKNKKASSAETPAPKKASSAETPAPVAVGEEETKAESEDEATTPAKKDSAEESPKASSQKGSKKKKKKNKKDVAAGKGVTYRVLKAGKPNSPAAKKGTEVTVKYIGQLADGGKTFDKNLKVGLTTTLGKGELIAGMDAGLMGMKLNEKRRIQIPADQAYGEDGAADGTIPPNSDLTFTVQRTA